MSVPLRWAVGDRCRAFGAIGRVHAFASHRGMVIVAFRAGFTALVPVAELELAIP